MLFNHAIYCFPFKRTFKIPRGLLTFLQSGMISFVFEQVHWKIELSQWAPDSRENVSYSSKAILMYLGIYGKQP